LSYRGFRDTVASVRRLSLLLAVVGVLVAASPALVALAAVALLAAWRRPRRAAALALALLLAVLAAETAVHSVHHLGDGRSVACAVAGASAQLVVALGTVADLGHGLAAPSGSVVVPTLDRPPAPGLRPRSGRAPPAPIA
jgi:hypothetical protein